MLRYEDPLDLHLRISDEALHERPVPRAVEGEVTFAILSLRIDVEEGAAVPNPTSAPPHVKRKVDITA